MCLVSINYAQDTTKSLVIKTNRPPAKYPLVKPLVYGYPLMAAYLLVQEANAGDPFAQHELALRYLFGKGFPADTTVAIKWLKKAVDKNLPYARFNYAIMLNNGVGSSWNPYLAFKNFKFAADFGMPEAEYAVGIFYTDNLVVNRDYNEAYRWIKKAADADLDYAKETLKKLKESGLVDISFDETIKEEETSSLIPPGSVSLIQQDWQLDYYNFESDSLDEEKGLENVQQLLNKNKNELKRIIGISDSLSFSGLSDTSATALIDMASKSGSPEALYIAGMSNYKGIEQDTNYIKAASLFLRAFRLGFTSGAKQLITLVQSEKFFKDLKDSVDRGNADAMYTWAGLIAIGFDFQLTHQQAFDLLKKAEVQNHIASIIEIGLAYYSGSIVKKDKVKAFEYWDKAAELGSLEANVRLAFSLILETQKDINFQLSVLQGAADEGSVLAESALGYCYENGIGVQMDKAVAANYYRKASQRGNQAAFISLKKMYDSIRPDEEIFQIYDE